MNIPPDRLISEDVYCQELLDRGFHPGQIPPYNSSVPVVGLTTGGVPRHGILITAVRDMDNTGTMAMLVRIGGPIQKSNQGVWDENDPNLYLAPDIRYIIPPRDAPRNQTIAHTTIGPNGEACTLPLVVPA